MESLVYSQDKAEKFARIRSERDPYGIFDSPRYVQRNRRSLERSVGRFPGDKHPVADPGPIFTDAPVEIPGPNITNAPVEVPGPIITNAPVKDPEPIIPVPPTPQVPKNSKKVTKNHFNSF